MRPSPIPAGTARDRSHASIALAVGSAAFFLITLDILIVNVALTRIGGGGALAMPPVSGLVLASVPLQQAGTASAVFNTFRQVGGAVAIAAFGALVAAPHAFIPGLQLSFILTAVLLGVSALLGFTSRSTRRAVAA